VFIGDDVYLENAHPEGIEIHDNSRIGLRSIIMSHYRGLGKVIIEKNVWTGPGCIIIAASGQTTRIGEGSVVAAGSVVNSDVSSYTFVGGVPAKPIAKITKPLASVYDVEEFRKGLKPIER
jgi:acetyltransferase-like isoleucine patch superfamily enzyme